MNILKAIIKNPFYVKPKSWSPEDTTGRGSPDRRTAENGFCEGVYGTLYEFVDYVKLFRPLLLF